MTVLMWDNCPYIIIFAMSLLGFVFRFMTALYTNFGSRLCIVKEFKVDVISLFHGYLIVFSCKTIKA